jgi:hypothetical protein
VISYPEVKWTGREVDHSPPYIEEVKNGGAISPLPMGLYGIALKLLSTGLTYFTFFKNLQICALTCEVCLRVINRGMLYVIFVSFCDVMSAIFERFWQYDVTPGLTTTRFVIL